MTSETNVILEKLESQERVFNRFDQRLTGIEQAVTDLAVQKKEIDHLSQQMNALWRKYDGLCGADGLINQVKNYQASCPRDIIKVNLARQWVALGLIATLITSLIGALKIWG